MIDALALLPLLALTQAAPAPSKTLGKRYSGVHIVSGRNGQCLAAAPKTGVGSQVTTVDCYNTNWATLWDINPGSGSVILHGSNLALDAGSYPGDGGALKVWTSYPTLYQQTWYLTDDNRIAITGGNQCLDEGDNGAQTWQCFTGNTNQVWYVQSPSGGSPSSPSPSPSPSPASPNGQYIQTKDDSSRCLTVGNGYAAVGTVVQISGCMENPSEYGHIQGWEVPAPGTSGNIRLAGTDYCLDAGSNPSVGTEMKIWTCYEGLYQQTYNVDGSGRIMLADYTCLEEGQDSPNRAKPYQSLADVTIQTCNYDSRQQFVVV